MKQIFYSDINKPFLTSLSLYASKQKAKGKIHNKMKIYACLFCIRKKISMYAYQSIDKCYKPEGKKTQLLYSTYLYQTFIFFCYL
jgi:hypothetical protein